MQILSLLLFMAVGFPLTVKLRCRAPGRKKGELGWFLFCQASPACLELGFLECGKKKGSYETKRKRKKNESRMESK